MECRLTWRKLMNQNNGQLDNDTFVSSSFTRASFFVRIFLYVSWSMKFRKLGNITRYRPNCGSIKSAVCFRRWYKAACRMHLRHTKVHLSVRWSVEGALLSRSAGGWRSFDKEEQLQKFRFRSLLFVTSWTTFCGLEMPRSSIFRAILAGRAVSIFLGNRVMFHRFTFTTKMSPIQMGSPLHFVPLFGQFLKAGGTCGCRVSISPDEVLKICASLSCSYDSGRLVHFCTLLQYPCSTWSRLCIPREAADLQFGMFRSVILANFIHS